MVSQSEEKYYVGHGRLRARDIRANPALKSSDPALRQTCELLAEQDGVQRKQIENLADLLNKTIDQLNMCLEIMSAQVGRIDKLSGVPENAMETIKNVAIDNIKLKTREEEFDDGD
jgi:hypothetical protein